MIVAVTALLSADEYFVRNEFQPLVGIGYMLSRSDGSREDQRILLSTDRPLVGPFERGTTNRHRASVFCLCSMSRASSPTKAPSRRRSIPRSSVLHFSRAYC